MADNTQQSFRLIVCFAAMKAGADIERLHVPGEFDKKGNNIPYEDALDKWNQRLKRNRKKYEAYSHGSDEKKRSVEWADKAIADGSPDAGMARSESSLEDAVRDDANSSGKPVSLRVILAGKTGFKRPPD